MAPVGTAVQYIGEGGQEFAAIVVMDTTPDLKNLVVFLDGCMCSRPGFSDEEAMRGLTFKQSVERGDGPGCWREVRPAVRRVVDGPVERFEEDGA